MAQILTAIDIATESSTARHKAGTIATDFIGREWIYVQAQEALVVGNVLQPGDGTTYMHASTDDVSSAAATGTRRVYGNGDFSTVAGGEVVDGDFVTNNGHTYYLWIMAGAGQGQGGPISKWHNDSSVDVYFLQSADGKISTALTTSSDFIVTQSTRVMKSLTLSTLPAIGVSQIDVTDEYWFWALRFGPGLVLKDVSDTDIALGQELIMGTSVGTVQGITRTTTATDSGTVATQYLIEQAGVVGTSLMPEDTVTADAPILAQIDCRKIGGQIPVPDAEERGYPGMDGFKG